MGEGSVQPEREQRLTTAFGEVLDIDATLAQQSPLQIDDATTKRLEVALMQLEAGAISTIHDDERYLLRDALKNLYYAVPDDSTAKRIKALLSTL